MKRIALACVVAIPVMTNAANPHYEFNNSSQQYNIEKAVYEEVIQQTLNTKCTAVVDTSIPESFIINNNRYVDVEINLYKDKKKVADFKQSVTYKSYNKFKYTLYRLISLQCK